MSSIKDIVDAMPIEKILPDLPEKATSSAEEDPTPEQISNVVDRLANREKYGRHRPRFCKDCGVTPSQLQSIEAAFRARLSAEAAIAEARGLDLVK